MWSVQDLEEDSLYSHNIQSKPWPAVGNEGEDYPWLDGEWGHRVISPLRLARETLGVVYNYTPE